MASVDYITSYFDYILLSTLDDEATKHLSAHSDGSLNIFYRSQKLRSVIGYFLRQLLGVADKADMKSGFCCFNGKLHAFE